MMMKNTESLNGFVECKGIQAFFVLLVVARFVLAVFSPRASVTLKDGPVRNPLGQESVRSITPNNRKCQGLILYGHPNLLPALRAHCCRCHIPPSFLSVPRSAEQKSLLRGGHPLNYPALFALAELILLTSFLDFIGLVPVVAPCQAVRHDLLK